MPFQPYHLTNSGPLVHDIRPLKTPICAACHLPITDATNRVQKYHFGECQKVGAERKKKRFNARRSCLGPSS